MSDTTIHGIPCRLQCPEMRAAVVAVLDRIRDRFPDDHAILLRLVDGIDPLTADEAADGTLGWWKPRRFGTFPERQAWLLDNGFDEWDGTRRPGTILLLDEPHKHTLATVAHELGHAVTTDDDLHDRGECPSDKWASELTADFHATRWGYAAEIAAHRPHRDWRHHCVGPGEWFEDQLADGLMHRFEVDSDYVAREVSPPSVPEGV